MNLINGGIVVSGDTVSIQFAVNGVYHSHLSHGPASNTTM